METTAGFSSSNRSTNHLGKCSNYSWKWHCRSRRHAGRIFCFPFASANFSFSDGYLAYRASKNPLRAAVGSASPQCRILNAGLFSDGFFDFFVLCHIIVSCHITILGSITMLYHITIWYSIIMLVYSMMYQDGTALYSVARRDISLRQSCILHFSNWIIYYCWNILREFSENSVRIQREWEHIDHIIRPNPRFGPASAGAELSKCG